MTFSKVAPVAFLALMACASSVPDSNPNSGGGVGFGGYGTYVEERMRRDAELQARRTAPVPEERAIAEETMGVLAATRPLGTAPASAAALPPQSVQPAPVQPVVQATLSTGSEPLSAIPQAGGDTQIAAVATDNPSISDEQSFSAVSSRETIESDRERLARQRESYQVIQPQAVPERPGSTGPNIVEYALSTSNRVGEKIYRRSGGFNQSSYQRACAKYGSSDQAQIAFLEGGGPRRDRLGLDPDGDGFACFWDPSPFRAARGG